MPELLRKLLELVYPPKCVFCARVLKSGDFCEECRKALPYTVGDSIVQKLPFIEKCISPLYYKDKVREAILRYKFYGCESYSERFGAIMAETAEKNLDCGSVDMISCIPLSRKRRRKRGYDQAELLAREISARTGVAFVPLLKKTKDNAVQSTIKDAKRRAANVAGVYSLVSAAAVKGKTILLVDDVTTTGATLSECARVLKKAGAKTVFAVTLARHED